MIYILATLSTTYQQPDAKIIKIENLKKMRKFNR